MQSDASEDVEDGRLAFRLIAWEVLAEPMVKGEEVGRDQSLVAVNVVRKLDDTHVMTPVHVEQMLRQYNH